MNIPLRRLVLWNLRSVFRWWHIPCFLGVIGLLTWFAFSEVRGYITRYTPCDVVFVAFAGPSIWNENIIYMLRWFIPHLLFFFSFGDMAEGELRLRRHVLLFIGSRRRWWFGKLLTLFLLSFGYMFFAICIASMVAWVFAQSSASSCFISSYFPGTITLSGPVAAIWIILLWSSTLFALGTLQLALSLAWRNAYHSFVAAMIILLLSWLAGGMDILGMIRWLPGSQSMLLRHTVFEPAVPGFSLMWSIAYNAFFALGGAIFGNAYISRLDITNFIVDTRLEERR